MGVRSTKPAKQDVGGGGLDRALLFSLHVRAAAAVTACLSFAAYATYQAVRTLLDHPQYIPYVCLTAAAAEAGFAVAWIRKYRRLCAQPQHHKPKHKSFDPRHAYNRFVQSPLGQHKTSKWICIRDMLSTWFGDVPIEEIRIGNVCDLVTYGFWYMSREEYMQETGEAPERLVEELMDAWDVTFLPGHNEQLSYMAHLWQPIRCNYRPLAFYLLMEGLGVLSHSMLIAMGFQSGKLRHGLTYYTYNAQEAPTQVPILFQHGVGVGLLPYVLFVARCACLGRPVAAVECAHLGMRWTEVLDADEVVESLVELLEDKLQWSRTCVAGHSYGTFYASRLLQLHPHLVDSVCLIDPVTFNMFTGKLIQNFVYKIQDITTWFVARDLHHAASVCRNFFWSCLCLWPDQLPARTLVVLSEEDNLVPVRETLAMLQHEAPHAVVMHHPNHKHADFLMDTPWQNDVVVKLGQLLDSEDTQSGDWAMYPFKADTAHAAQHVQHAQHGGPALAAGPLPAKQSVRGGGVRLGARGSHLCEMDRASQSQLRHVGSYGSVMETPAAPNAATHTATHTAQPSAAPSARKARTPRRARTPSRARAAAGGSAGAEAAAEAAAASGAAVVSETYSARLRPRPHRVVSPYK